MSAYELPTESGEQRLQRLRDRNHLWQQRGLVAAFALGFLLWLWNEGAFDGGWHWGLLWLLAIPVVWLLVEGVFEAISKPIEGALSGMFRPLSGRGYSYYDEEELDPAPDYSMAEVIVDPEDPKPQPKEAHRR